MPTISYPAHEPISETVPFLRSSLSDIYVVSHEADKIFHLKDLTFHPVNLSEEYEVGAVVKKNADGSFEEFEIDDSVKAILTEDPEVIACVNAIIVSSCTGKTIYDVSWWAGDFNNFMQGFCERHFEV